MLALTRLRLTFIKQRQTRRREDDSATERKDGDSMPGCIAGLSSLASAGLRKESRRCADVTDE